MFNFNHLYYFYITAKCDGISKASKFLRIAQPSLSSQLHTLEAQLNITLFQRDGRRMVLTEAGRTAFAYCRKIFEAADEFKDFLNKGDGARGARVTLGVCNEIERPFVVELVSQILTPREGSRAPRVTMISGPHSQMLDALQRREVDGIFTNHIFSDKSIRVVETILSPVFLCCNRRAPAPSEAKATDSAATLLKSNPIGLLLPGIDNKLRTECDEYLIRNMIQNTVIFESDIMAAVVRATIRGLGAGFFPIVYVIPEIIQGTLITLGTSKPLWNHRITFAISSAAKDEDWMVAVTDQFSLVKAASDRAIRSLANV